MRSKFRKRFDQLGLQLEASYRTHVYRKKARLRLKRMKGGRALGSLYEEVVLPFWAPYSYKPNKMWYQIFWDRTGEPDPRYIPDDLWFSTIVPYFSNPQFRRFGEDKCMHEVWFPDVLRPRTITKNVAGVFYDAQRSPISEEEALALCLKEPKLFIKPSIDSGEGRLIHFVPQKEISKERLLEIFHGMGANFIVQEEVTQHPTLAKLNASSLNTIRVVSFFFKNKVHILSSILRIGAKGSKVDNIGAGGYACVIQPNGQLQPKGVNRKAQWVSKTNEGIAFADVEIPSYEKILDVVRREHQKLAHFKLIGWDFSVTPEGDPLFIEFNVCPGPNQITCGPTFGDLTQEVLEEIFVKKTLALSQN
ncbi:putative hexapeptide transferase family protein [Clostridiaceae bacterium JG1575]|nr:putative hexapeptide transferase family protein [Clostridiaceae bacterium JG1575]